MKLIKTKDRELLHYVLFSFRNYHLAITKVDVWLQLPESIRDLYIEVLSNVKQAEDVVKCSWRYHITYLKVAETILDSNSDYNDDFVSKMATERPDKEIAQQQNRIKAFNTILNVERKDIIKGLQALVLDKKTSDSKIHEKRTSHEAKLYGVKVLAKLMTSNKQFKFRQNIQDFFMKLAKQRERASKHTYVELVTVLITEKMISSKSF